MFNNSSTKWRQHFLEDAKLIFSNNHIDGVIITDSTKKILYTNQVFSTNTGYSADEALGKSPAFLQGPLTDRGATDRLKEAINNKTSLTIELINYRKNHSTFWNEFSITPYSDPSGALAFWIGIQRNITQQKRLQEELLDAVHTVSIQPQLEPVALPEILEHKPKRILIVEDEMMTQAVIKLMLNKLEIAYDVAENGSIAVNLISKKPYMMVLMDIQMPVMNGLQATQTIRKAFPDKVLPIIGMSAGVLAHDQMACINAGMNSFIGKPIQFEALKSEIIKLMPNDRA